MNKLMPEKCQRPRNDKVRVHPASPVETVAVQ
jgi:hypothetical protein